MRFEIITLITHAMPNRRHMTKESHALFGSIAGIPLLILVLVLASLPGPSQLLNIAEKIVEPGEEAIQYYYPLRTRQIFTQGQKEVPLIIYLLWHTDMIH